MFRFPGHHMVFHADLLKNWPEVKVKLGRFSLMLLRLLNWLVLVQPCVVKPLLAVRAIARLCRPTPSFCWREGEGEKELLVVVHLQSPTTPSSHWVL